MIYPRFLLADLMNERLDIDTKVSLEDVLAEARTVYGKEHVENAIAYIIGTRDPIHDVEYATILAIFGYIARCMRTNDDMIVDRGLNTIPKYRNLRNEFLQVVLMYGRILF